LNETLASLVPIGTSVPRAQSPQTHKKKQISKPISKTASVTRHPKFSRNQSTTKSQPEQTKAQEHARPAKENKSIGLSPNSTDGPHGQDRKEFTRATKEVAKKLANLGSGQWRSVLEQRRPRWLCEFSGEKRKGATTSLL
jgi:hypothetical protein